MRVLVFGLLLLLTACGQRDAAARAQAQADLREFVVLSGLLEISENRLALDRFAALEFDDNELTFDRFEMLEQRETIFLSGTQPDAVVAEDDDTDTTGHQVYDGFLDYTLFGLGGAALEYDDQASLDLIITLLQRRRDITSRDAMFGNCQRALLADILIESHDLSARRRALNLVTRATRDSKDDFELAKRRIEIANALSAHSDTIVAAKPHDQSEWVYPLGDILVRNMVRDAGLAKAASNPPSSPRIARANASVPAACVASLRSRACRSSCLD